MKSEYHLPVSEILKEIPTDDDIDMLYELYGDVGKKDENLLRWGNGLLWEGLHFKTSYPYSTD